MYMPGGDKYVILIRAVPSEGGGGGGGTWAGRGAVAPLGLSDFCFVLIQLIFVVAENSHKYVYKKVLPPLGFRSG